MTNAYGGGAPECRQTRCPRAAQARWAAALAAAALLSAAVFAGEPTARCASGGVLVSGSDSAARESVCEAVAVSEPLLASMGLAQPQRIAIQLEHDLFYVEGLHALGSYDRHTSTIHVLDYRAAGEAASYGTTAFGAPMTPALWRSYLVHELAHAAACARDRDGRLDLAEQEYLAGVAQLASLPEDERAGIFRLYAGATPFRDAHQIQAVLYFFDPGLFAVRAYLHFVQPGHGAAFVESLFRSARQEPGCD